MLSLQNWETKDLLLVYSVRGKIASIFKMLALRRKQELGTIQELNMLFFNLRDFMW